MATAIAFLMSNLIGLGLGPVFIGLLSDWAQQSLTGSSLGLALMIAHITLLMAAGLFLSSAKHLETELEERL